MTLVEKLQHEGKFEGLKIKDAIELNITLKFPENIGTLTHSINTKTRRAIKESWHPFRVRCRQLPNMNSAEP